MVIFLPDEKASQTLAQTLAMHVKAPLVLTFSGDIGAGKTTFIRAMLRALGVTGPIKSPTYTLVESYLFEQFSLHHFDLYRISDSLELDYLGFREYFTENTITCIEWPAHAGDAIVSVDVALSFEILGHGRQLTLNPLTAVGEILLTTLGGKS